MTQYGSFPGVQVDTATGGVQSVTVGTEEKLVLFGEATYTPSLDVDGDGSAAEPQQINAPKEAEAVFGAGSELAEGMKEALANGATLDFLYGVAVPRKEVTDETQAAQQGTLDNVEIVEDTDTITFDDGGTQLDVEFRYTTAPSTPTETDTVYINPLTGDYAADAAPGTEFSVNYQYNDYSAAFNDSAVANVVDENETGVFWALTDADAVSVSLQTVVSTLRDNYQLVTGFCFAEPNDQTLIEAANTTPTNGGANPQYDTANYESANQSVASDAFFKLAPARVGDGDTKTFGGGAAGLYAGNSLDDPIYNEQVTGYSSLQQKLNKTEADELRSEDMIPVRSGGSVRIKGNRSTNFSANDSVAADFWTRRITDRVILIAKEVGDATIGKINNPSNRTAAQTIIQNQLGRLASNGLIEPNTGSETNFNVQVYEDSTNKNEVNIDVQFTPYGIVKRVDAGVTINV